jgi:predicted secreted protein
VKRSARLIRNFKLSQPGVLLAQDADARTSEVESRSGAEAPLLGKPELIATHASLGRLEFRLTRKEFDWPATSRLGRHKNAEPCKTAVDWQKGAGFRLTLVRGRETIVLNDDKTIPASRFCASGYGIAAVHAFDRPDGKVTLAVVLGMSLRGFEGDDRRFLAVTRVLAK